jgi:hypothetical protein
LDAGCPRQLFAKADRPRGSARVHARGLDVRRANVLQLLFAEQIWIAFSAALGNANYLVRNGFLDIVIAVPDPQSDASKFVGNAQDACSLRIEVPRI